MSFWPADDHMLIMNLNPVMYNKHGRCVSLTDDDLARLSDAGAKTVIQYGIWSELVAHGWGYLDTAVALAQTHGMRSMIFAYHTAPHNLPKEWYCWKKDKSIGLHNSAGMHVLSLWNMEARAALIGHLGEIVNRYPQDTASVVFIGMGCGETVLPNAYFYEPSAIKSHAAEVGGKPDPNGMETRAWVHRAVVDLYTAASAALLPQHNQTLNAMHQVLLKNNKSSGAGAQEDIFAEEYKRWPDADRYLMQYTYWPHVKNNYKGIIDGWREKYKIQMIAEASYCVGLPRTAPLAIAAGMRGQLVGPRHPETKEGRLKQEHIDAIAAAIRLWEQSDRV